MAWLKLDDQIFFNNKVAQCDAETKLFYIVALTYCANQLTDGFVPAGVLPLLAGMAGVDVAKSKQIASNLLEVCLWSATEGGWLIPDFLEYNPSREQVKQTKSARSRAGKRGGDTKSANSSKTVAKPVANAKQNPSKILPPPPPPPPSPYKRDEGKTPDGNDYFLEPERENQHATQPPLVTDEEIDLDFGSAVRELEALGVITGTPLLEFKEIWPELKNGKRGWVGDAVRVAQANDAFSVAYAVRVLRNSLRSNRQPGTAPPQNGNRKKGNGRSIDDIFDEVIYGNT